MLLCRPLIQFWCTVVVSPDKKDEIKVEQMKGRLSKSPETLRLLDVLYTTYTYVLHLWP